MGPEERQLRILLDEDAVATGEFGLLSQVCGRPGVHVVSEATDALNRLEFQPVDPDDDQLPFTITTATGGAYMAIWPYQQWVERARVLDPQGMAVGDLSHGVRLAAVAQEIEVDALVTANPLLLDHRSDSWLSRANVRSVQEAIALVGLFLRCRGDYTVWPEYRLNYGRWGYYWGLTRELLPAAWRWFGACVQSRHHGGAERVQMLGQAALQRVDRALRCRDIVHIEVSKPDSRDAASEALFHLNALLVALGGAFDAVARVAHIVYEMPLSEYRLASWGKRVWLKELRRADSSLAAQMAPGTIGRDSLDLVSVFRNCLHGEALDLVTVSRSRGEGRTLVTVPDEEATKVRSIAGRYPPANSFGIEEISYGLALRPEVLCEALLPWALRTLDGLMAATDVARLPGVSSDDLGTGPTSDDRGAFPGLFADETRRRLRALGGL